MELDTLSDLELQQVHSQAGELLASRKKQRQRTVIEEIRAKLAEEDLTLQDLAKAPRVSSKATKPTERVTLTNPADPSQKWTAGRGRPPAWAKTLQDEAAGKGQAEGPASDRKRA